MRPRGVVRALCVVVLIGSLGCEADDFMRYDTLGTSRGTSYVSRLEARDDAERLAEDTALTHCAAMGVAGYEAFWTERIRCRQRAEDPPWVCDISWKARC